MKPYKVDSCYVTWGNECESLDTVVESGELTVSLFVAQLVGFGLSQQVLTRQPIKGAYIPNHLGRGCL